VFNKAHNVKTDSFTPLWAGTLTILISHHLAVLQYRFAPYVYTFLLELKEFPC